jgi:NAD(P)H-dependent FMN reductase
MNGQRIFLFLWIVFGASCTLTNSKSDTDTPLKVYVILGSTREGRTSEKIGAAIAHLVAGRTDVETECIDLRDYPLPFLHDAQPPATRTVIVDPAVQQWSEKIARADAFIMVVPEYNAGYPGVFKNALDSLYKEWSHKPVGFIIYSGSESGGASVLAQLKQVVHALKMVPVQSEVMIPSAWKVADTFERLQDILKEPLAQMVREFKRSIQP